MSISKINLTEIFKSLENKYYTIIKLPEIFPLYKTGSDLDIFCFDVDDFAKNILAILQKNIDDNLHIETNRMDGQMYIDLIEHDKIHFRFDLYDKLPKYNNVNIKKGFFSSVIESSIVKELYDIKVKIPSKVDEVILRYIEYHEWFVQRPDKIKHIHYIEDQIRNNGVEVNNFFDKLHFYIDLPKLSENRKVSKFESLRYLKYLFSLFKKVFFMVKNRGFISTIKTVKSKYKK
jgi:hypothetical protein